MKAYLTLETGDVFTGEWIGSQRHVQGEVVFYTGMSGYQEVMTDPAYTGQIVTFTYPLIGNCGIDETAGESNRPHVAAVVVGEMCTFPSPFTMTETLGTWLERYAVPGIAGVDTRAVATVVREHGVVRGTIGDAALMTSEVSGRGVSSLELVKRASVKEPLRFAGDHRDPHIVLIDYGYKKSLVTALQVFGCRVTVVPYNWSPEQLLALEPDGIVLSGGPGDPLALFPYAKNIHPLLERLPTLAIGLGHQVAALTFGGSTERLVCGHRGCHYPVRHLGSGRVWMTSQHHGFTVVPHSLDPDVWEVTHVNVNDGSIEGLKHKRYPLQSVQFHPRMDEDVEAAQLFKPFISEVNSHRKETAYA